MTTRVTDEPIIRFTDDGYPTPESLERLRKELESGGYRMNDLRFNGRAIDAFYSALRSNHCGWCGPDRVEVRGEMLDVWAYHTGGWSGNEQIIHELQRSYLWNVFLQRYDAGGHYYFDPPEKWADIGS